ncbi:MAG: ADP-ribosylglycohydrolase family protein [Firmicutes bacterium]|nr:ADP-ribosylglycohydrolase family protein [Bacillota bacterium]
MLGAIIGDICGSVYEFDNERRLEKLELFKKGCFPTDDSVMTAAVARALMDSWGDSDSVIRQTLVDAMHYYGHLFPRAGYGGRFFNWLASCDRRPYNSWGNGSGMRVSPAGWMYDTLEETLRAAKLTAEVTHDHPEGIKGAQAIAAAIFLARAGSSKEVIRQFTEDNFYALDFTLDEIRPTYEFTESCQGSCPQAIEAFLEGDSFEDVILKAISIGGDSDTIAAMAGAIAEAYYGIPEEMKQKAFDILQDTKLRRMVYHNSVLRGTAEDFSRWIARREGGKI